MALQFGECRLDLEARQLLRAGRAVHLSRKAFDLLAALVQQRPRALSKAELMQQLWPDTYVIEANLSNLVGDLRAALGDDRRDARVVRTVHSYGYAFCAETSEPVDVAAEAPGPPAPARLVWATGAIALMEGDHIIGRDDTAGIVFDSPTVSRRHARLAVRGGAATIEDLASQNGTWVNEQPVTEPTTVLDGDRVRFGLVLVTFRTRRPAITTQKLPTVRSID
jgi:DNA-binding winged helix-turn-helix (wHTH) protein